MKRFVQFAVILLCLGLSTAAFAANGWVVENANLRAGPDRGYPRIMRLHAGTAVSIQGCVDGFTWCDVIVYGDRGWIAARFLQFDYDNRRVYIPEYGARIGIPIISFVLGSYWDNYYRTRPWYRDRDRWGRPDWNHHRPSPRPPYHRPPKPKPPVTRPPTPRPPVTRPPTTRPPVTRPPNRPPVAKPPVRPKPPVTTPSRPPTAGNPGNRPKPPATVNPGTRPKPQPRPQPRSDKDKNKDNGGN